MCAEQYISFALYIRRKDEIQLWFLDSWNLFSKEVVFLTLGREMIYFYYLKITYKYKDLKDKGFAYFYENERPLSIRKKVHSGRSRN